jgi:hydroxymethylbilane synthase
VSSTVLLHSAAEGIPQTLRIGTRGSILARTQTEWVAGKLRALGHSVSIEIITTTGDTRTDVAVAGIGGDGVFVRELERALIEHRIDVAVHSLKDLPTAETPGLDLACVPRRAVPFDALVGRDGQPLAALPNGAIVGTSSVRRTLQIRLLRPDIIVRGLRGNVDTRLRKLETGEYDGIVLAAAGLQRLGLGQRISDLLEPDAFYPAISQGALALQTRSDDPQTRAAVAPIDDPATHSAVLAERACLGALAGGCLAPIGGIAQVNAAGMLELGCCILEDRAGGVRRIIARAEADPALVSASSLGLTVAAQLREQGADRMLAHARHP